MQTTMIRVAHDLQVVSGSPVCSFADDIIALCSSSASACQSKRVSAAIVGQVSNNLVTL
jgi:hypothetical protein